MTKFLFVAAGNSKLKMHDKNMVSGQYACVLKFVSVANICNYDIQTCMEIYL